MFVSFGWDVKQPAAAVVPVVEIRKLLVVHLNPRGGGAFHSSAVDRDSL